MKTLRKIDPWSTAKISGVINAILGLVIGILYTAMSTLDATLVFGDLGYAGSLLYGPAAIVALPLFYGIAGLVMGLAGAYIYNLTARWLGGIKIELK